MSPRKSLVSMLVVTSICAAWCAPAIAQPVLTIEGACPGALRAEVRGARPERSLLLLFSPNEGQTRLPKFYGCGMGVTLGLDWRGLKILAEVVADETGFAAIEGFAGPAACGAYLQTLNRPSGGCETSNVAQIP